jgi:hypothetical protein
MIMAIDTKLKYAKLDELSLDPMNARLGRNKARRDLPQPDVLKLMADWTLDELAVSFLESGFWPHEALLVVRETLYGKSALVVVEGNRRLAALQLLHAALKAPPESKRWKDIVAGKTPPAHLFEKIPYIEMNSRKDIEAFLGFRHVTGIKEWKPAEKADYIAKLIDESHLTYEQVMRKIGSTTPVVRQNYIAFRLLLQMEQHDDISVSFVEDKFSVLYLSLRTHGVQQYLRIDIKAEPRAAKHPVPSSRTKALARFALWLFGNENTPPIVKESRQVDDFGRILESKKAVEYLERSDRPSFDVAFHLAGGDEPEVRRLIEKAADNIELALSRAHLYLKSQSLKSAVKRLGADATQLLTLFPDIQRELLEATE